MCYLIKKKKHVHKVKMIYLITGGAGYIGSCVSNYLLDMGHKVIIVDNLSTGSKANIPKKSKFYKCNIQNEEKISKILNKHKIDVVMHFAAYINNEESLSNPKKYLQNNFINGKKFLTTCINHGLDKIIYSSTASVYGQKNNPVSEKSLVRPLAPYPKSKLKLENFLKKNKKKISCIILRYFNVAGADKKLRSGFNIKKGYNLILNLCQAISKNKVFKINGNDYKTRDGTAIRDFIHVSDLSEIHYLASQKIYKNKLFDILNCGYGKGFSVFEILNTFSKVSNQKIKFTINNRRNSDIIISISNPSKLKKLLHWVPKYQSLNLLAKSSLRWYIKSKKN